MFPRNHGDNLWRYPLYIPEMMDKSGEAMPLSLIRKIDLQVKDEIYNKNILEETKAYDRFKELAEKEGYILVKDKEED